MFNLQKRIYCFCINVFSRNTNLASYQFSILENQNSWNVSNAILGSKFLVSVYIHFTNNSFTFVFFLYFSIICPYLAARTTQGSQKVNQYRLITLKKIFFKCCSLNSYANN